MPIIEIIALLALAQFLFFGYSVGMQRGKSGVKAPATAGDEGFERAFRVQMNTLELLVVFLPALFIAGSYWSAWIVAPIGIVYLVGRMLYARAYMTNPSSRTIGFMLSFVPAVVLLALSLLGAVLHLF